MRRRGASAYRAAVRQLSGCKFIEAHEAVKGTRAERPVVDLIVTMTNHINELSRLQDRLDNVLDYYELEEPTPDQVYDAWERDNRAPAPGPCAQADETEEQGKAEQDEVWGGSCSVCGAAQNEPCRPGCEWAEELAQRHREYVERQSRPLRPGSQS